MPPSWFLAYVSSASLHHLPPYMAPVLSSLSGSVRCERCSQPLPRYDNTIRGQTDRSLCSRCYRVNPLSVRITIRIPPVRQCQRIRVPETRQCPSCSMSRPITSFGENNTMCHSCRSWKMCTDCRYFSPPRKFLDNTGQPNLSTCLRCRSHKDCDKCGKTFKLKSFLSVKAKARAQV
jgi:hypothetical protein